MANASDVVRTTRDTYPFEVTILDGRNAYDMSNVSALRLGLAAKPSLSSSENPIFILTGDKSGHDDNVAVFDVTEEAASVGPGEYFGEVEFLDSGSLVTTKVFNVTIKGKILPPAE